MGDYHRQRRRSDAMNSDRRRSRSPAVRKNGGSTAEPPRVTDPFTMRDHVSFDYFCTWYQSLNPGASIDDAMQTRYDEYSADLLTRTAKPYVEAQRSQPWFQDLYNTENDNSESKKLAHNYFKLELEKGTYNTFNLPQLPEGTGFGMSQNIHVPLNNEGDIMSQILTLSNIPPTLSRTTLEAELRARIDSLELLSISAPRVPELTRTAWVVLRGDTNSTEVRAQLDGTELKQEGQAPHILAVSHYRRPASTARARSLWSQLNEPALVEEQLIDMEALVARLDSVVAVESLWPLLKSTRDNDPMGQLDLACEYLRNVHFFDYWNMRQYDSTMDIQTHAPRYSRVPPETSSNQRAFELWLLKFKQKQRLLLAPEQELANLRIKSVEECVADVMSSKIKQEEASRYRCQVLDCTKLFQDVPFVHKHIAKRHGEWLSLVKQEQVCLRRYLSDPNRILPYKQFREPRGRRQSSVNRNRRRSPRGRNNAGPVSLRAPRGDFRSGGGGERGGGGGQSYRDLDRPAEELPELDY